MDHLADHMIQQYNIVYMDITVIWIFYKGKEDRYYWIDDFADFTLSEREPVGIISRFNHCVS